MKRMSQAILAALSLAGGAAQAATVYSNDFDAASVTSLGASSSLTSGGAATASTTGSYAATYGQILRNDTAGMTTLTLSNLPTHTGLRLSYVLALLDSWDSRDGGCCSPDNVDFYIDGNKVASYTYNNASGSIKDIGGGTLIGEYVQFDSNQFYSDTVANMASDPLLAFAHTASSITFGWQSSGAGFQYGGDESWGIDNIVVDLRGVQTGQVPEPGSLALVALAAAGLGASRRRR